MKQEKGRINFGEWDFGSRKAWEAGGHWGLGGREAGGRARGRM